MVVGRAAGDRGWRGSNWGDKGSRRIRRGWRVLPQLFDSQMRDLFERFDRDSTSRPLGGAEWAVVDKRRARSVGWRSDSMSSERMSDLFRMTPRTRRPAVELFDHGGLATERRGDVLHRSYTGNCAGGPVGHELRCQAPSDGQRFRS